MTLIEAEEHLRLALNGIMNIVELNNLPLKEIALLQDVYTETLDAWSHIRHIINRVEGVPDA